MWILRRIKLWKIRKNLSRVVAHLSVHQRLHESLSRPYLFEYWKAKCTWTALTWWDNLESLAYTLFSILRGSPPYHKLHIYTSTPWSIRHHVFVKKQDWPGVRLAEGYEEMFGQFLDETCNLEFDELPSYNQWQVGFSNISYQQGSLLFNSSTGDIMGEPPTLSKLFILIWCVRAAKGISPDLCKLPIPQPPYWIVEPGQLIYTQLLQLKDTLSAGRMHHTGWIHHFLRCQKTGRTNSLSNNPLDLQHSNSHQSYYTCLCCTSVNGTLITQSLQPSMITGGCSG